MHQHRVKARLCVSVFCVLVGFVFSGCTPNTSAKTLPLASEREQQIPLSNAVTVTVVEPADGDSFVVAGGTWGRKFSKDGSPLWEYVMGDNFPNARYLDAAPMLDGSTFLCGHGMQAPGLRDRSALLTHLDARGRRLSEAQVSPETQPGSSVSSASFQSCVGVGSHVLLHGYVFRKAEGAALSTQLHWFAAVDGKGAVVWQREIPKADFHSFSSDHDVLLPVGNEFYFSETNNAQTELLRLSASGDLLGRIVLSGPLHLVRDTQGNPHVELFGLMAGKGQFIRFTNDLKEENRITLSFPEQVSTTLAFKLRDGSFCLFGSNLHSWGQRIRPAVTHVDAGLHTAQTFEPAWERADNVIVTLPAAPIGLNGDFVTAVGLVFKTGNGADASVSKRTSKSLALDYFRLQ